MNLRLSADSRNCFLKMTYALCLGLKILLATSIVWAIPPWAKSNTQERVGSSLRIVCQGEGPSVDIARKTATSQCIGSASHQLQTDIHVQTVNVESEKSVAYFQEISSDQHFSGLVCQPKKEEVEETKNGLFQVWLLCDFNLPKIKQVSTKEEAEEKMTSNKKELSLSAANHGLAAVKNHGTIPEVNLYMASSRTTLYLETVPMCASLIIRGETTRNIQCTGNPQPVVIDSSDREIIVQADGCVPKTVNLKNTRNENGESIRILLDSN